MNRGYIRWGVKKAPSYSRLLSLMRSHIVLIVSRWSYKNQTFVAMRGEFTLTLKDEAPLTMLSMFGNNNTMGVALKGEEEKKLLFLATVMTA